MGFFLFVDCGMKKINEQYIKELAEGFNRDVDYVRKVVKKFPNPREHYAIIEDLKPFKFTRDFTHLTEMKLGKYKGVTAEDMIRIAKECDSYTEFRRDHSEFMNFLFRIGRLDEVKKYHRKKLRWQLYYKALSISIRFKTWSDFIKHNDALYRRIRRYNMIDRVKRNWMREKDYVHVSGKFTYQDYVDKMLFYGAWKHIYRNEKTMYMYISNRRILREVKTEVLKRYKIQLRELNKYRND